MSHRNLGKNLRDARLVLGINNAYHESAAAIIVDGRIVASVEEERFSGRKHGKALRVDNAHHLPMKAIDYCLREAGATWRDLDAVAYSLDPALRQRQACVGLEGPTDDFGHPVGEAIFQRSLARVPGLVRNRTNATFHFVPHHSSHAWYALGTSSFERAAVLVMDGIGEGASVSLGRGTRGQILIDRQYLFPRSIGLAWEKVARFLGFSEYDACKVMALAGLDPSLRDDTFNTHIRWGDTGLEVCQEVFDLEHPENFSGLERLLGCQRSDAARDTSIRTNIAAALQQATEQVLLNIARELHAQTGEDALAYAGGVALNCRANAELAKRGPFAQLHIGPAAHDAGTALGAAWNVYSALTGRAIPYSPSKAVVGTGPSPRAGHAFGMDDWKPKAGTNFLGTVTRWLADGAAVGWVDGRCEFGPRALGRRSLLASPLLHDAVERINRLKGRYWFEPLALTVTIERADEIFVIPPSGHGLTPYMLMTVRPHPAWQGRLAHLLHGDGTVRLQTVAREDHPRFHALLRKAEEESGIPLLINTSFNPRGRPVPATMEQVMPLACELGIHHLAIDGVCWTRTETTTGERMRPSGLRLPELVYAEVGR